MTARPDDEAPRQLGEPVAALMRRNFVALAPQDSLLEAFQLMRLARLRLLPVVREGVLVGVLAFVDVLGAVLHELRAAAGLGRAELEAIPVERVMSAATETLGPQASLAEAARRLCRSASGCIPVVEAGRSGPRLLGLVVESDLLRAAFEGVGRDALPQRRPDR
jgi:CBS domain-containing protein